MLRFMSNLKFRYINLTKKAADYAFRKMLIFTHLKNAHLIFN
ncbi:hypothetical protein SAMN05660909_05680 [Chitinophaga terrae (ex Kim and Jung 2007)]|uniref:Uncharacterized protein n=1 Tax=Chitinophaga terrae (ex Kim and Jung 2007) TaxID=408074 RepID=A0A1H4GUK6_9BACT|nr:hypothetical protein SAMN05660909_05680 [Chitinophaga terrae (ex Kim and Jung 2007)]